MSSPILVDTGALVALLNRGDQYHPWVLQEAARLPYPFYTCEAVLTEAFFLLRRFRGNGALLWTMLMRSSVIVGFRLAEEMHRIQPLMAQYSDIGMSFADACLVRVAELQERAVVFTTDSHFATCRMSGGKPLRTVLPPHSP